jgi:hypothetical protein
VPAERRSPARRHLRSALVAAATVSALLVTGPATAVTRSWTVSASFPPPIADLQSVACFSATGCVAVGYTTTRLGTDQTPIELRTVDAGALWAPVALTETAVPALEAVGCSGTVCVAGGTGTAVLRSADDGLTWSVEPLPAGLTYVATVACPTSSSCYAAGHGASGAVAGSTDGGISWALEYTASSFLTSLWCTSSSDCFTYGAQFFDTTDGTDWGTYSQPSNFPTQAVCPSSTQCVGTSPSSGIVTSSDGGATWSTSDGSVVPTVVTCATASTCVGTDGTNVVATTDGGSQWTESTPAFESEVLTGVACPSAAACQVVGSATADGYAGRALLLSIAPSSGNYTPEAVTNAVDMASSVSCVSTLVCDVGAVDPYANPVLLRTTNGAHTWTQQPLPPQLAQLDAVRCTTTASCLASGVGANGGGAVFWTGNGGATWARGGVAATVGEVDAVVCTTATSCEGIGYLTNSWTAALHSANGGRSWASTPMPHTATNLYGVACPTAPTCVVVGSRGTTGVAFYSTTGGRSWRPARVLGGLGPLNQVACVTATTCLAGTDERHGSSTRGVVARTTDGGAVWTPVGTPGAVAVVLGLSCVTAVVCQAVGQTTARSNLLIPTAAAAMVTTNGGRSWAIEPMPVDQWALYAVSCARSGACVAGGVGSYAPPNFPTGATILRLN